MRTRSWLTALLLACSTALTGCGIATGTLIGKPTGMTSPKTTAGRPDLSADPALPASYRFVLTASCGERTLSGDYRLIVRDGEVAAVEPLSGPDLGLPLRDYPTLADLLARARDAGPGAAVHLEVDDAGVPVELGIDHLPDAIDDEECYEVSDLETLPAGAGTR